jgi:LPXTG-motif cell wall-anchored protein
MSITGLERGTEYVFETERSRNGVWSETRQYHFTTLESVPQAGKPEPVADTVTDTTIALSWEATENAVEYNVSWKAQGSSTTRSNTTKGATSYTVSGLAPDTEYVVTVRGVTDLGVESEPGGITVRTTPEGGLPTEEPSVEPTVEPTEEPTVEPTVEPTSEPTVEPTADPTVEPTEEPTVEPTHEPTVEPTEEPTVEPSTDPTAEPTEEPTVEPTVDPSEEPTVEPTDDPTSDPSEESTDEPTGHPTDDPSENPSEDPSDEPTEDPTDDATDDPSEEPTDDATDDATDDPSDEPGDDEGVRLVLSADTVGITDFLDSEKGVTLAVEGLEPGDSVDFQVDPISGQNVEPAVLSAEAGEDGVASTIVYGTSTTGGDNYLGDYEVTVDADDVDTANAGQDSAEAQAEAAAADDLTATFSVVADDDAPEGGDDGDNGDGGNGGDNGGGDNGDGDNGKQLPRTGATLTGLFAGIGAIAVGAGALFASRRRRS